MANDAANEALWKAARERSRAGVEAALAAGADLEAHTMFEGTALAEAASAGHLELVEWLLDKGANPGFKDGADMTPLHLAVRDGHTEVVELLLGRGKPLTERVINDVLYVAQMSRSSKPEIARLLENHRLALLKPSAH